MGFQRCPVCNGTGKTITGSVCPTCKGTRMVNEYTGEPPKSVSDNDGIDGGNRETQQEYLGRG